jgi:zinc protease
MHYGRYLALWALVLFVGCATSGKRSPKMTTVHVENHTLAYVAIGATFQAGAAQDPKGKEGLSYLTANMLLRGTKKYSREQLMDELDFVGSSVGVSPGRESTQFTVDCSTRNLPVLLDLLQEIFSHPTFPEEELEKLKRQTLAELSEMKDSDSTATKIFFSELLFQGHPYAHPTRGYETSLAAITRADVAAFYEQHYVRNNLLLGVAGDLDSAAVDAMRRQLFAHLKDGPTQVETEVVPAPAPGLDVLLVTRPDRSQAQVAIGQTGILGNSPLLFPLDVAITGFGGTFTSVLVREIREKRGWSYGVGAAMVPGRHTGLFQIRFAPANADVVPAITLTRELLAGLVANGLEAEHIQFAQDYLANQYPFLLDTPLKKLELALDVVLSNKPADYVEKYVERVRAVTPEGARAALAATLQPDSMVVVVVGDPSLAQALKAMPGVARFRSIPFSWDGPLPPTTDH